MSYKLTDRFTLGAGARYFEEDQEQTQEFFGTTIQTARFHSVDPRLYARYELTSDVNVYASAARGFRSGGFNFVGGQPSFDPESVWTYELGTKGALLEGRLHADIAVFYSNYTDYVVFGSPLEGGGNAIALNAGDARIRGVEWGLEWRPADQWTLRFNGAYLDTEFTKINATSTAYNVGDPLDRVPKYQYTVSGRRDFNWSGRRGFARLDYSQQGRAPFRNRSIGPWYFSESDVINMLGYYMSLQWNKNLSLNLFAQNLLNDRGFASPDDVIRNAQRPRPRTYGIGFSVTF
jgi:outer membrane receptor protein involved in Fe transport